jgi:hypothetical protein
VLRVKRYPAEYLESVDVWHKSLRRDDLAGRLLEAICSSSYRRQVDDKDAWLTELDGLGQELFLERGELGKLLPSLVGGDHHGGPPRRRSRDGTKKGTPDSRAPLTCKLLAAQRGHATIDLPFTGGRCA